MLSPTNPLKHFNRNSRHPNTESLPRKKLMLFTCTDCSWSYVGETGRSFETRKKEHLRNVKNFAKNSNIATHAWNNSHNIELNNAKIIDNGLSRIRKNIRVLAHSRDRSSRQQFKAITATIYYPSAYTI